MKRNRIQILIVEDDAAQGKALHEAFTRAGYQATLINTSIKALSLAQRQEFHCVFVDCMLPKMNGVDLVKAILESSLRQPKVFLYSGIFKDKQFIKDSTERTNCIEFFTKPLNLPDVLAKVEHALKDDMKDDEPPVMQLYCEPTLEAGDLVSLMEEDVSIHGYHLPALLRHLVSSSLSGDLTIISAEGAVSSISVYDGTVFAVRTPDKNSFFGGLAVGFGFVTPEEVHAAMNNPDRKLLGMKLFESFALSPHGITLIMEEQLALRISQCVQNCVVNLQWSHRKYSVPECGLNPGRFDSLISDWIDSKLDLEWLRSCATEWSAYKIKGEYHSRINDVRTLGELISHREFNDVKDLPYFFHQLLKRETFLTSKDEGADQYNFLEKRLDRLLNEFKEKDHFQVLNVGQKAHNLELNKSYAELKSFYDPSLLAKDCPPGVLVKCTQVFRRIDEAYAALSDDDLRAKYISSLQAKRSQSLLEFEPIYRAGIIEMIGGNNEAAAKKFQSLIDRKLDFSDLRAYRIWAGLKCNRNYQDITLEQVPPEQRHSGAYMMARGVMYRHKGLVQKAAEAFRTAYVLDSRLLVAKTELEMLVAELEKNRIANRALIKEINSIIDSLFGAISMRGA